MAPPRAPSVANELPSWEQSASRLLRRAAAAVSLVGCATPTNLTRELGSLVADFERHAPRVPRFVYAPAPAVDDLRVGLVALARALESEGPLGRLYAERALELELEAQMCVMVGREGFFEAARRRFGPRDELELRGAELARAWLQTPRDGCAHPREELVRSDDDQRSDSLVSRMRAVAGALRLPVRVVVTCRLAALAATGAGVVYVKTGQMLSRSAAERTVVHELLGHAQPREHAMRAPLGIFAVGTARGSDDQEGRALWLEHDAGLLGASRRRELAARHIAALGVEQRAGFVETVGLLRDGGVGLGDAVRIAARVHRGGGLARERVYLPALLRVSALLAARPGLARVLGCGRVSCEAAPALSAWLEPARS